MSGARRLSLEWDREPSFLSLRSIQALERAQGYLKLPNGRALTGHSHDYKRNGTSTPFAAFEVATGKVMAAHKKRRRRVEFLDFMNDIVAVYPDTAIHVVLDNLIPTSPKTTVGSSVTRTCGSTSRRRGLLAQPGRNLVLDPARKISARCFLHLSQNSFASTSMPSSRPTMETLPRSSGPNPRSTKNASNRVSWITDSGY
jgi:hypothetical protein